MNVKIYGAGSIGNHLAYACRNKGWDVVMCDVDLHALERTKEDIYPARYGRWDPNIQLSTLENAPNERYDVVIIGTPPDTHLSIAKSVLAANAPRLLLLEKPVCTPSLEGAQEVLAMAESAGTMLCVGYNHTLTTQTIRTEELLEQHIPGTPITISARFREHWGGIFKAHPWLAGPQDTYLGFWERGGGACGEHSHAINIWQHFANDCGMGRIREVTATLDMVKEASGAEYDRVCLIQVLTEKGYVGDIAQDVVTEPAQKVVRIQGDTGYIEWSCNIEPGYDAVLYKKDDHDAVKEMIEKTRPDDFKREIDHIETLLRSGNIADSPIALERGLDTMLVVAAAHLSHQQNRTVKIHSDAGYCREALEIV